MPTKRVLLVEDSPEFQLMIRKSLGDSECQVTVAESAAEAERLFQSASFDLVLLDISLPDGSGFEFCARLKGDQKTSMIPVLFISGRDDITDKLTAFSLGGEDYITKPFHPLELRARVTLKLKLLDQAQDKIVRGPLTLESGSQRVIATEGSGEREIHLTPREFRLLWCLARSQDQIFTREQLLTSVFGANVNVLDRTVDSHIAGLRKKLGIHGRLIEAVAGVGYRFSRIPKGVVKAG